MGKLYLICGFVGSGKTTYAKKLAKQYSAHRFSPDEWMIPLFGEHMDREQFDLRLNTMKALFKVSAIELIKLNVSVIFDFGFWNKSERKDIMTWAKKNNIKFEMRYLDVSYEECCKRVYHRNVKREDQAYEMTPEMMSLF